MVTKGHDVPGVTLVAVVAADQVLNFPDFRAAERTFQMLAQVAGRAGRGDQPGRVLIQTYRPTHYALTAAAKHDFLELVDRELPQREALGYPPFSRLVNLRLDGVDSARVEELARALADALRSGVRLLPPSGAASVIGPAPAPLERLRGRYRWQILVKSKDPPTLRAVIRPALEAIERRARSRGVRVAVDVDPYGVL
jgi:primosomal protein N' (replication factor Y)